MVLGVELELSRMLKANAEVSWTIWHPEEATGGCAQAKEREDTLSRSLQSLPATLLSTWLVSCQSVIFGSNHGVDCPCQKRTRSSGRQDLLPIISDPVELLRRQQPVQTPI